MRRAVLHRTLLRSAVLLCLPVVAAAGCSSSSSKPAAAPGQPSAAPSSAAPLSPDALLAASYSKMAATKTARLDMNFQLVSGSPNGASGSNIRFGGGGLIDFAHQQADLTVTAPTGQKIEERLLGKTIYIKLPPQAAKDPELHGKTWLKTDLDKAAQSAGLGTSSAGPTDPTQILQMLTSISNGVTKTGTETVRGTSTSRYHASIDLAKAAAKQGNTPAQTKRLQQLLGTSSLPVDVWVDDAGLTRRLRFQMPIPKTPGAPPELANANMTATEEFYDFGVPTTITAPPATQTQELPLGNGSSGGTASSGSTKPA